MIQDIMAKLNIYGLQNCPEYQYPNYVNGEQVLAMLSAIVDKNATVLIEGDYDMDGLMCAKTCADAFDMIGFRNYTIFNYRKRTHGVDYAAVQMAIQKRFDYMIIMDSGSSSMKEINQLLNYGIKVIIMDHHETKYSYADFDMPNLAIINTMLENQVLGDVKFELSAGALVFTVMSELVRRKTGRFPKELSAYALSSLYADCMNMGNELNRSIYYEAIGIGIHDLPIVIQYFISNYTRFSRRFIEFWFAPRINSLFRSEIFEPINYIFFSKRDNAAELSECLQQVEKLYLSNRNLVRQMVDVLDYEEMKNFTICNLDSIKQKGLNIQLDLKNYTGLVANQIGEKTKKPCIVYSETVDGYKGSFRDLHGRDYLEMFSNFCNAGGHGAAFGFTLNKFELGKFYSTLQNLDEHYAIQEIKNAPYIIRYNVAKPDDNFVRSLAVYNDFAGTAVPVVYLEKTIVGNLPKMYSSFYYTRKWGDFVIQSNYDLSLGETVLLKPINSSSIKLIVQ